jgi:hypothetical protein
MRNLNCPKCHQRVFFEQVQCNNCSQLLAFDVMQMTVREFDAATACANRDLIGCNWSTDGEKRYCPSCALTRTIPNLSSAKNLLLWNRVEQAKRRLVYDLYRLKLPLAAESGTRLCFDILSDEAGDGSIMTGHSAGLITLNVAEADDVEREARRVAFREPYRTLLGHFRHEVGHFYWELLVAETRLQGPFRLIFGDESNSYQQALREYHGRLDRSYNHNAYISEYASSHPWEDWAETFAHFLHIVSALDSVAGLPLSLDVRALETLQDPYLESDFNALLASWTPLAYSMNELNRSLGLSDAYPFQLSAVMSGKLHFAHMVVQSYRDREGVEARSGSQTPR